LKEAHVLLARAAQLAPDDMQTRYALGLSYLAQGHLAFAEQAFRGVVEKNPAAHGMRHMLADVIRRQGNHRFGEAAEVLEGGLRTSDVMPPDMMRFAGELWLMAGETGRALPLLRRAAAAVPDDRVTLDALIEALRRNGDADDARHTLEAALAAAPEIDGLWSARLSFEPADGDPAAIGDRWHAAIPESVHPLHLQMWLASQKGDAEAAKALAHRIIEREPGHIQAQTQIIDQLYQTDPPAAVAHIQSLLPNIPDPEAMRLVLSWLARAHDRAGQHADAAATWARLDAIHDPLGEPLPLPSGDNAIHTPAVGPAKDAMHPMFVFGAPGSGIERVLDVLNHNMGDRVRTDRTTSTPPRDPLQFPETARQLAAGELDGATVAAGWRAALPARGVGESEIIDWLPWWDNALLRAFRGPIPEATVVFVLADPRDMLIDWLQRGTFIRYAIDSHMAIAEWLAGVLEQVAAVIEGDLMPHRELRMDEVANDTAAIAAAVAGALDRIMLPAPALGPGRYPAGHWRLYREALAGPFALLTPVAQRLGYPET
jgi:tetratricopeptide (TPR) repeat protein